MSELAYSYKEECTAYEFINGAVYMISGPKAAHVRVNGNLHRIFSNYLKGKTCEAFNQFNVYFSEEDHFIPDEMIVCNPDMVEEDAIHGVPDLVVEILSKSTARKDKNEKFFKYEYYGVKEYWLVDPANKTVEIYLLKDGKLVTDGNTYAVYTQSEWNLLNNEEKAESKAEIKVSLYDDFYIKVEDIFDRVK